MKSYSFFLIFLLPLSLFASDWTMEVRAAYFSPSSKEVRHIYSKGWVDFQVESSRKLNDYVEVWAGVNWMNKHGHVEDYYAGLKEKTKLSVLPISLGLKFVYPLFRCLDVYAGIGGAYSFLKLKSDGDYSGYDSSLVSTSFKKHMRKSGWGGVAKLGLRWTLGPTTFIDLFADYFEQRFHVSKGNHLFHRHLNCSGFKLGGGFGVYF